MACDAQSVETLLVNTDKYYQLSQRQGLEWLAQLVLGASQLTVDQAIDLAATNKMAALSDRQLEECRLAVFTAALYDAQTLVTEMATQQYPSLDRHDLMCATIAAYCGGLGGSASSEEVLSAADGYFKFSERGYDLLGLDAVICDGISTHCTSIFALRLRPGISGMSERHLKEIICALMNNVAAPQPPGGFTIVQNADGTITVTWDIPGTGVASTEVFTSTDDINFTLFTTIPAPGNSTTIPAPGGGTDIYIAVRSCNTAGTCGHLTTSDKACAIYVGTYALDDMESYTNGVPLNGLSGGVHFCTPSVYADRTNFAAVIASDDMESYSTGTNLFGYNGGTGWNGAYAADNVTTDLSAYAWVSAAGNTLTLAITAQGGFPAYTYQWYKGGVALTNAGNISGVTTATLAISNYQSANDDGVYTIGVTDTSGRAEFVSLGCTTAISSAVVPLWAIQVVTNGGHFPSKTTIDALTTFNSAISTIRSTIKHLNLIVPDSLTAMATPFIADEGLTMWVRKSAGVPPTELLSCAGWKGASNDASGYCYDTGVVPSAIPTFSVSNAGLGVYYAQSTVNGISQDYNGGYDGTRALLQTASNSFDNNAYFLINDAGGAGASVASPNKGGFYLGSRTANNRVDGYFANSTNAWSSIANNTNVSTATPCTTNVYFGGSLYPGNSVRPQAFTFSFFVVCDGLSSANGQTLYNAVQAFRVAIGGGYI